MALNVPDFMSGSKKKTKLNKKQIAGLAFGFFVTLGLLVSGYYALFGGLWMIVLPALLYLLPHIFNVKDPKIMAGHGVAFLIVALLAGGFYSAPDFIDNNGEFKDSGMFSNTNLVTTSTGYTITSEYTGDDPSVTPMVEIIEIYGVGFYADSKVIDGITNLPGSLSGGTVEFNIPASDVLCTIAMYIEDGDGNIVSGSASNKIFLTEHVSDANLNKAVWTGVSYMLAYIMILYFMILFFTYLIRSKANKTRARMIEQGRLYPDGYGRCKECDAIVLPGEINCRKCGAYIDVPKEFRPNKVDFFECENCGAEVPEDAEVCPKCGVTFSETEVEVLHADGTVEVVESTFGCPSCGAEIPIVSEICPKCGKMFRK